MKSERFVTNACIALTLVALSFVYVHIASSVMRASATPFEACLVGLLVTFLAYGSLVYLLARSGYISRQRSSVSPSLDELEDRYLGRAQRCQ